MLNKYLALLIVLIVLLVGYAITTGFISKSKRGGKKGSDKGRKNRRSKNGRANRSARSDRTGRRDTNDQEDNFEDRDGTEDDDGPDDRDEPADRNDARELYNIVHQRLCKGMQQEEFEEVAGHLAGNIAFIELKQLYNQCIDHDMDPMKQITVEDYVKVLKKEDGE
jgi:hypothetical protein